MPKRLTAILATNDERIDDFLINSGTLDIIHQVFYQEICLELVLKDQPDVLILSEFLPGNKYPLVELIRTIREETSKTRIIVLMGYHSHQDTYLPSQLINMGVYDFLIGEFTGEDLLELVENPRAYKDVAHLHSHKTPEARNGRIELHHAMVHKPRVIKRQIVAFWSPKGGVGTTTLAVDVATILSNVKGVSTVLADLDLRKPDIHLLVNAKPKEGGILNLVPLIDGERFTSEYLLEQIVSGGTKVARNLNILPGVIGKPELAENLTVLHVDACLKKLQQNFDIVIVNTSSNISEIGTYVSLNNAHRIIVVTTQDATAMAETYRYLGLLKRLKIPLKRCTLVVDRYDKEAKIGADLIRKVVELEPKYVFPKLPRASVLHAQFYGCPLSEIRAKDESFREYKRELRALGHDICPMVETENSEERRLWLPLLEWVKNLRLRRREYAN